MRLKPVPPAPESLGRIGRVREAVPLTPGSETDCCQRLVDRAGVPAQDDAKTWLTFLRALGLAEETAGGKYVRTRDPRDPDREYLAERFVDGVYGTRELLEILGAEGPLTADQAFEAYRPEIPEWERQRHENFEHTWRVRVGRMLEWAVLLGLATTTDGAYDR